MCCVPSGQRQATHFSVVTRQKLWDLGRDVLMRPPHSPNLDQDFYERSIMKLPLKWLQIIQENCEYLT
ncbi:UNVERIFIED_CONTAM: hypothetical protein NCL1_63475 [Trichonephila clavipes]